MQRLHCRVFPCANVYRKCYCTTRDDVELGFNSQRLVDFPATYNAKNVEQGWYELWQRNDYFNSHKKMISDDKNESFNMVLPPPNITGVLHLGHALTATIQDILARWHRMKGHRVSWIPGLDHAGIATQVVVERHLHRTSNLSRFDVGKEQFTSLLWQWKREKADVIKSQLKILGASLDWKREYFTIDENHSTAVTEAFVQLYERNLLYRDCNLVNWSPALRSTISEIEVENLVIHGSTGLRVPGYENKVTFGRLMKLAYPIQDSKEELIVATTRPETMFGDVAIAVHPDDERYARYIGRRVLHPIRGTTIPIVADFAVKREFGTGAVKITPAHDRLDHEIAKRHNLPLVNAIDENGNMTKACNELEGVPRFVARERLMNELTVRGILRGVDKDHDMILPRCSRSQDVVEYLLKEQWYVRCNEMANKAIDALNDGSLSIIPSVHEQVWRDWLGNARDWCVSRQLWWGHRIPAYSIVETDRTAAWIVARSEQEAYSIARKKYGHRVKLDRDPDVLDTWFSSAIVPFAAFGWPKHTQDLTEHYPLTLMETGHDILMFWVARMVMLSLELTQRVPFVEILLHGILCDANGKKMSKSSGNVILPENIINGCSLKLDAQARHNHDIGILSVDELRRTLRINAKVFPEGIPDCGADALRMTLCGRNIKNHNISFDIADCRTNKYLCNKIWQASKYVLLVANEEQEENESVILNNFDRWILSRLSETVDATNAAFTERNFHVAIAAIREFLHYEFCDLYVEGTKFDFKSNADPSIISGHSYALKKCLEVSLRLLAPIAPYLVDDLYTRLIVKLPGSFLPVRSLLETAYPESKEFEHLRSISLEKEMHKVTNLIDTIRGCVANVSKKLNPEVNIVTDNTRDYHLYEEYVNLIKGVSKIWNVSIHLRENYAEKEEMNENDVQYIHINGCWLLITVKNASAMERIKGNILRRQDSRSKERRKLIQRENT